jgi:hypothetical protein
VTCEACDACEETKREELGDFVDGERGVTNESPFSALSCRDSFLIQHYEHELQ